MYWKWRLLLLCLFIEGCLTENSTDVRKNSSIEESIKNKTNKISLIDRSYCGYENKEASVYEFPWLIFITAFGWTFCSGTLVNARYVLTSGDCAPSSILGDVEIIIRMGDFNLKNNQTNCTEVTGDNIDECTHFENFGIEEMIPHPLYNATTFTIRHNIGLIRLNRTISYKEYMRPVCLPTSEATAPKPGDTRYLSGWLVRYDPELGRERIKKKIPTTVITREECVEKFKALNWTRFDYTLYSNNECLIESSESSERFELIPLLGDNGGAVMSFNNNQWKMEGVLLTYRDVGNEPLIYTKISMYLDWIEESMRPWE